DSRSLLRTQYALTTTARACQARAALTEISAMPSLVRSVTSARNVVLFAVAAVSLAACHKKKPTTAPAPTTTTTVNTDSINAARRADSVRAAQAARDRFVRDSIANAQRDRDARLAAARTALTAP